MGANSKSIQNWKQKLFIWNDISFAEISKLLHCCLRTLIFLWLVYLYCSNTNFKVLLTWVCSCMMFQYFSWNIFIFSPNLRDQPYSWNLSEKVYLMYEDSFPVPLFCSLKYIRLYFIHNSVKSSCKWLIPFQSLPYFLKLIPGVLGRLVNFKIPKRFLK